MPLASRHVDVLTKLQALQTLKLPNLQTSSPPNHKDRQTPSMPAIANFVVFCHPSGFPVVLGRHLPRCNPTPLSSHRLLPTNDGVGPLPAAAPAGPGSII